MDTRAKAVATGVRDVAYAAAGAMALQAALWSQVVPRLYARGGLPGRLLPQLVDTLPFLLPALLGAMWIAHRRPATWRISALALGAALYLPYAVTVRVVGGSAWERRLLLGAAVLVGCWAGGRIGLYLSARRPASQLRRVSGMLLGLAPLAAVALGMTSVYLSCPGRWHPAARREMARFEIPVFPAAQGIEQHSALPMAKAVDYTVGLEYPSLEVLRFYRERLRATGWNAQGEAGEEWSEYGIDLGDERFDVRQLKASWTSPSGYLVLHLLLVYESPGPDWPPDALGTQRVSVLCEMKHL